LFVGETGKVVLRINRNELERHTEPFRRRLGLANNSASPFFPFVAYALTRPDQCRRGLGDMNNRQPLRNPRYNAVSFVGEIASSGNELNPSIAFRS
jgi:hypothetical protein